MSKQRSLQNWAQCDSLASIFQAGMPLEKGSILISKSNTIMAFQVRHILDVRNYTFLGLTLSSGVCGSCMNNCYRTRYPGDLFFEKFSIESRRPNIVEVQAKIA